VRGRKRRCQDQDLQTTTDTATEPGPVTLDIDRRLTRAEGSAVVELLLVENAGCGAEDVTTTLSAVRVSMSVTGTGTGAPIFTGIGGTAADTSNRSSDVSYRFARDGTGVLDVGGFLQGVVGAAELVYGVDRSRVNGTSPDPLESAAPPGGKGATGVYVAELDASGGLGPVYEDAFVFATTSALPETTTSVVVDSLRSTLVQCPDGSTAQTDEFLFGGGGGQLAIGHRLASATASATVPAALITFDGCDEESGSAETLLEVPVSLRLTATGPVVRVRNLSPAQPKESSREPGHEGWFRRLETRGASSRVIGWPGDALTIRLVSN
jgi:hypothetical protein